jgi:excinuclease ABC subunit C
VHFAGDFDLINVIVAGDQLCCYVSCYRAGQNYGAKPYFFAADEDLADCLEQFLGRFYWQNTPPALILCNINLHNQQLMSDLLSSIAKHKVTIEVPKRGDKYQLMQQQYQLGLQVLEQKISQNMTTKALLLDLKKTFALTKIPQRIEVYDNSHTQFSQPVGAMIVAGLDGFIKSAYRKFYIKENAEMFAITSNKDDTAMLKQVLYRRFSNKQLALPDLLLIDGGKPQLQAVVTILQQLHLDLPIICMAKGEKRNSGEESYYTAQQLQGMQLPKSSPLAYYLQRLRDEAHRFAISNHRLRRAKAMFSDGD